MHSMLRAGGFAAAGLLTLAAVAVPVAIGVRPIIGPRSRPLTTRCFEATPARLERGRYLVTSVAGCFSCHGEPDWQAPGFPLKAGTEGGGRVWDREGLPYVTAPNITPDRETGAGTWTDDMLTRAIREGIGHDGRTLFPLMPYTQYRSMSDADVASIVVYLRSLPALTDEDLRAIFTFLQAVPGVAHRVDNTLPPTRCPVCGGRHGAGDQNVALRGN